MGSGRASPLLRSKDPLPVCGPSGGGGPDCTAGRLTRELGRRRTPPEWIGSRVEVVPGGVTGHPSAAHYVHHLSLPGSRQEPTAAGTEIPVMPTAPPAREIRTG